MTIDTANQGKGNETQGEMTKSQEGKKGMENKSSSLLSMIFPSIAILLITAIFYYTGWVYIAHWYSFYGIDATQVNVPLQLILLHGFPGVVVLTINGSLALLLFSIYKKYILKTDISIADLPYIILGAYLIALIVIFVTVFSFSFPIDIPAEVWITSFGLVILWFAYSLLGQLRNVLALTTFPIPTLVVKRLITISPARVNILVQLIVQAVFKRDFKRVLDIIFLRTDEIRYEIKNLETDVEKRAKEQSDQIVEIIQTN